MTEQEQNDFSQNMAQAQGAGNTPRVPIKERQQDIRKELDQIAQKDSDDLSLGEAERDSARRGELTKELLQIQQELERLRQEWQLLKEVAGEDIKKNEDLLNLLGKEIPELASINLDQEAREGNILLPTEEQLREAQKLGLIQVLIVPGHIARERILQYFQSEGYTQDFADVGGQKIKPVYYTKEAKEDLENIKAAQSPSRPNQFYTILLSPQQFVKNIHNQNPNLFGKSGQSAQYYLQKLEELKRQNPDTNLDGLTLQEYLLFTSLKRLQTNQFLDGRDQDGIWHYTRLLKEIASARCLSAGRGSDGRSVLVRSADLSSSRSAGGARFAAVSRPR